MNFFSHVIYWKLYKKNEKTKNRKIFYKFSMRRKNQVTSDVGSQMNFGGLKKVSGSASDFSFFRFSYIFSNVYIYMTTHQLTFSYIECEFFVDFDFYFIQFIFLIFIYKKNIIISFFYSKKLKKKIE